DGRPRLGARREVARGRLLARTDTRGKAASKGDACGHNARKGGACKHTPVGKLPIGRGTTYGGGARRRGGSPRLGPTTVDMQRCLCAGVATIDMQQHRRGRSSDGDPLEGDKGLGFSLRQKDDFTPQNL
ncbi:hypothetical protein B296_00030637, partial [Ensete ventricosum]